MLLLNGDQVSALRLRGPDGHVHALTGNDVAPQELEQLGEPGIGRGRRNGAMEGEVLIDGTLTPRNRGLDSALLRAPPCGSRILPSSEPARWASARRAATAPLRISSVRRATASLVKLRCG